jgi:hypothetical protein
MFALDIWLIGLLEVMACIAKKEKKIANWKDDRNMSP